LNGTAKSLVTLILYEVCITTHHTTETNMKDYQTSIITSISSQEAFDKINRVTEWWTENLKGDSQKEGDEFSVQFGDVHYSKQKLIEVISGKRVVWLVTDCKLNFIKDQQEWSNTKIKIEISESDGKTKIEFSHLGLLPEVECYDACSNAWSQYIHESLLPLINTGKGNPTVKE
jgi:hypothetical protein